MKESREKNEQCVNCEKHEGVESSSYVFCKIRHGLVKTNETCEAGQWKKTETSLE